MPWFWDLVQLSTEIPLQLLVSITLLKQSHNYVLHSKPLHRNLSAWCLGVDRSKSKASLWRWQRELLPLKGLQQRPSTSQSGPYLRNGAENSVDFTTPSETSIRFFVYLYQVLNRRPSTIDGYRTAIVDTLGPAGHHIPQAQTLTCYSPVFSGIIPKFQESFKMEPFLSCLMSSQKHPLSL